MARLVRADRKATVTQITTRYNHGLQKSISEFTTRQTLKQMGYSRRRPHRVPVLLAKNRNLGLQFDWKNIAWSDESRISVTTSRW